jgi:F420H(2)-dependent quinone reductase
MSCGIGASVFRQVNRVVVPVVKTGVASLLPLGPALVVLETVGRRTHQVRTVPVVALRFGNRVLAGTVRGNSHWAANVDASRSAAVWLSGDRRSGQATVHHGGLIDVASIDVSR